MGRIPVLTTFRTGDEVQDRNFDHIKQTLNPVLRNPLLAAADFRWMEIAATSATGTPTFALQYRTQETWATILTLTSAGQIVQPAWIAIAGGIGFTNSWVDFGNITPAYFKDVDGRVWLRGDIRNGTITQAAFTLPAGYRPSAFIDIATASNGTYGQLNITSGGVCTPAVGTNLAFSLNGISFDTR